jgi:endonuclease/exonuclease/phosphatase family metal-dependent hydrolase
MHAVQTRKKLFPFIGAAIVAPLLLIGALSPLRSHASPSLSLSSASATSPSGKVLVVTTNLRAAWGDQGDMRVRMSRYVDRLLNQAPYFPDVLLLQEVKRNSADRVASLLSRRTRDRYVVAVRPPRIPWRQTPKIRTETDSAIVINRTTTKKLDHGGYISLTFKRSDAADPSKRVEINQHARLSVQEISSGMKLSVASVHFQYRLLKNRALWRPYQKQWAQKVAKKLGAKYPGTIQTVGGDFNRTRCIHPGSGTLTCTKNPFWRKFVNRHHYMDTIYRVWRDGKKHLGLGGVDFIFTKGLPTNAQTDVSYNQRVRSTFYSDHHFVWATISAR